MTSEDEMMTSQQEETTTTPTTVMKTDNTMAEFTAQLSDLIETNKKILETLLHQLSVQSAMLQQMLRAATTFTEVAQLAELSTTSESFK